MTRREQNIRLFGWIAVVAAKLVVVVGFHVWSLNVGHRGLAPIVIGGDDGIEYLYVAERIAQTGSTSRAVSNVWAIWVGQLMGVFGVQGTFLFKLILFSTSLGTAVVGVKLLRRLAADLYRSRPTATAEITTAAALLLFPSTLWITSYSIYRDGVLYFLSMVAVYTAYLLLIRKQKVAAVWLGLTLALLFPLRWYATVSVVGGVLVWMLVSGRGPRERWQRRALAVVLAGVGVLVVARTGQLYLLDQALTSRDLFDYNQGGSNLGLSYSRSSVVLWPVIYLYTFVTNLIGPLPNQIEGVTTIMGFVLEVPLLLYVLVRLWRSPATRRPEALLLVAVAAVWLLLLPIYNDNIGTGLRLRVLGYQFLFVLCALDVSARRMLRARARHRQRLTANRAAFQPTH